jgi:hypothetical protein
MLDVREQRMGSDAIWRRGLFRERRWFGDGAVIKMTVWRVPGAVLPISHAASLDKREPGFI